MADFQERLDNELRGQSPKDVRTATRAEENRRKKEKRAKTKRKSSGDLAFPRLPRLSLSPSRFALFPGASPVWPSPGRARRRRLSRAWRGPQEKPRRANEAVLKSLHVARWPFLRFCLCPSPALSPSASAAPPSSRAWHGCSRRLLRYSGRRSAGPVCLLLQFPRTPPLSLSHTQTQTRTARRPPPLARLLAFSRPFRVPLRRAASFLPPPP